MSDAVAPAPDRHFSARRVAAFTVMVFGMFMAILDIQIVSASLQQIQAGLSASSDEITWVQTAYLIAEVIMIPLSGYLSRAFSTRIVFVVSAAGFTLMSFLCSRATSIDEMIVWRAAQGFIGGGMIPTVFATAYSIFPPKKLPIIAPIIGLVATLAPTIGPTAGGLLTDLFDWRWLFLVNLAPGVLVSVAAWLLIDFDQPDLRLLKNFDWLGLLGMAAFLGALEYALEEGPSKDWFESAAITQAAILSTLGAIVFFWRAFTARQPIVDLTAFRDRNFWSGSLLSFVLGIGLYGLTYIYPVYLAVVRGYSPLMIGNTMFVTGACQFMIAPIVGAMMTRIDPRLMIAVGFIGFGAGTWQASYITVDWDFWELLGPADPARLLADAVHGADQQPVARHHAARSHQERLRPVQSDPQPRRRLRPGADQHHARQAHGPASRAAARGGRLGSLGGRRNAGRARRRPGVARLRRDAGGDPRAGAQGAAAGRGAGARRRLSGADGDLCRPQPADDRNAPAGLSRRPARGRRALSGGTDAPAVKRRVKFRQVLSSFVKPGA